jgi:hypothetical protein
MERTVTLTNADLPEIYARIYGFWEDLVGDNGVHSLEELYELDDVEPRPADQYIWDLGTNNVFTFDEIDELERQLPIIRAADYPQGLKNDFALLLRKLKREQRKQISNVVHKKAINQAIRIDYEKATGQSAAPGHGSANIIRNIYDIRLPRGAMGGRRTRKNKSRKSRRN